MYGLVNKAIKDLAVTNHGQDKWDLICEDYKEACEGQLNL